jgi:hypothetical protein
MKIICTNITVPYRILSGSCMPTQMNLVSFLFMTFVNGLRQPSRLARSFLINLPSSFLEVRLPSALLQMTVVVECSFIGWTNLVFNVHARRHMRHTGAVRWPSGPVCHAYVCTCLLYMYTSHILMYVYYLTPGIPTYDYSGTCTSSAQGVDFGYKSGGGRREAGGASASGSIPRRDCSHSGEGSTRRNCTIYTGRQNCRKCPFGREKQ